MPFWRDFFESATTILLAAFALAILAVLVSKNAATSSVIQASASGVGNIIGESISPVTGRGAVPNLGYPNSGGFAGNYQPLQL